METVETKQAITIPAVPESPAEEKFKPTGALAFFGLLILLVLIFWYGIYFLMLSRS
jgi:hypothetical protein